MYLERIQRLPRRRWQSHKLKQIETRSWNDDHDDDDDDVDEEMVTAPRKKKVRMTAGVRGIESRMRSENGKKRNSDDAPTKTTISV